MSGLSVILCNSDEQLPKEARLRQMADRLEGATWVLRRAGGPRATWS
jgi:hypothetical protein